MKTLLVVVVLLLGGCTDPNPRGTDARPLVDAAVDAEPMPDGATGQLVEWRCHCPGYGADTDLLTCGHSEDEAVANASTVNCPPGWACTAGDQPDWSCQ